MNALSLFLVLLGSANSGETVQLRPVQDQAEISAKPRGVLHRIRATESRLTYDAKSICPVVTNPRDGSPDVPEETWKGFIVEPILEKVTQDLPRIQGADASFSYSSPEGFPFAFSKYILRSMGDAGVKRVYLALSDDRLFPVELYLAKTSQGLVHSGDPTGAGTFLLLQPDSILVLVDSRSNSGKRTLSIPIAQRGRASVSELERLDSVLVRNLSRSRNLSWVVIDPHPMVSFGRIVQVLESLDRIRSTRAVPSGINVSLSGVYVPW